MHSKAIVIQGSFLTRRVPILNKTNLNYGVIQVNSFKSLVLLELEIRRLKFFSAVCFCNRIEIKVEETENGIYSIYARASIC